MSDEVPSGRLSQIFDPLTNLQQPSTSQQQRQQQTQQEQSSHFHQQYSLPRQRSNSSSPSPSTSGRATPASLGATSVGSGGSSSSSHHHQQQQQPHGPQQAQFHQQQSYQYLTQTHNYFLRPQDGSATSGGGAVHNYLHTFPSAANQSHYFQQQYQQYATPYQQQQHLMSPFMQHQHYQHHSQQQQHSLPPLYATSHSLNSSPLLAKRAISFSGNMPMSRQQMECGSGTAAVGQRSHAAVAAAQSTPNSPRLMPRRTQKPPPIPAKPTGNLSGSSGSSPKDPSQANTASSLDGSEASWPHLSALTEYLDVHQVNNYSQGVPEINWQERCLELQLELHRSKNQAGRIRDMLREKADTLPLDSLLYYLKV
ncbi:uncharacterized protein LOC142230826 [Haematobia irritans]|uniref:uncharacterized protein LOC142230826 n=1 Tax=Haematobia irritans TaxID=7368 RepID=UPI003F4F56A3